MDYTSSMPAGKMAFDPSHASSMLKEAHHHMLQSKRLQYQARKYVDDWAMSSCLDLCTEMQSRLPRELRNLVYASLLQDSNILVMSRDALPGILESHRHVRDTRYMGQETFAELVEEWYHHCLFVLDTNADIAPLFRTGKRVWGISDLDVSLHIRHVHIEMFPRETGIIAPGMPWNAIGLPWDFYDLTRLRKPATVILNMDLDIYEYGELAEEHAGALKCLIDAGVKVAVMIYDDKTHSGYVGLEHLEEGSWTGFLQQVWDRKGIPMA